MTPPVRGRDKLIVAALLLAAAAAAAALIGFAAGVAWEVAGLPQIAGLQAGVVVAAAVLADAAHSRWGRPRPLAVRRQVPQAWSRLFSPRTVAVLYGARLGVGPLTILPTWLWWAALVLGASGGPWRSAAVGIVFAVVRSLAMTTAAQYIASSAAPRMARLLAGERPARALCAVLATLGGAAAALR